MCHFLYYRKNKIEKISNVISNIRTKQNLFLGVCLAPYRLDFYNYLYEHFNCNIYFQTDIPDNVGFNIKSLESLCLFPKQILNCGRIGRRTYIKGLKTLIKNTHPKVIFVPEFSPITIQVILLKKVLDLNYKIISICDDSIDMINGNDFSKNHRIARRLLTPLLNNLILPDNRTVEWYQKNYGKGIWLPIISDDRRMRINYKNALPLSKQLVDKYKLYGMKVILFVGRLVKLKNIERLLKAYAVIKDRAKLIIIGDGEERLNLELINKNLKCETIFLGQKGGNELSAWYNICDILVLPSLQEPFGAVTNEALLAGCRVIVSNRCGSACLVTSDNGEIIDPINIDSIVNALKHQLTLIDGNMDSLLKQNKMPIHFIPMLTNVLHKIMR